MQRSGAAARPHPPREQQRWAVALLLAAGTGLLALLLLYPPFFPYSLPLLLVVVPIAQFALTPLWQLTGVYRYYSRVLFVTQSRHGGYELHGGTSFDYLRLLRGVGAGGAANRCLVREYLIGLLGLICDIEKGKIAPTTRITGTSYFFSNRSARRLGFSLAPAPFSVKLHLLLDILSIVAMYSYARGRPALPRIFRARVATTTAAELTRRRSVVERLLGRVERSAISEAGP